MSKRRSTLIRSAALALSLSAALLGFRAHSIDSPASAKPSPPGTTTPSDATAPVDTTAPTFADTTAHPVPPDSLIAYYFHRTFRCDRCLLMEACIGDVIKHDYSEPLKSGRLRWRPLDYEQPAQADEAEKYQTDDPVLVLSHWKDGTEILWTRMDELWGVIDDPEALSDRVRGQLRECLAGECRHDEFFASDTSPYTSVIRLRGA